MALTSLDNFITQIGTNTYANESFFVSHEGVSIAFGSNPTFDFHIIKTLPGTLLNSMTAYIPTEIEMQSSVNANFMWASVVNMGNLNLGTNTFTAGNALPAKTELGLAAQPGVSPLIAVVTTATDDLPGSFTVTYVDQNGNAGETTAAQGVGNQNLLNAAGFVLLNSTDWGVRSISAAAQTGGTTPSGVITFYGIKNVIAMYSGFAQTTSENLLTVPCNPVRLTGGEIIACLVRKAGSAFTYHGRIFMVGEA